jgi:hypothetical protein
MPVISTAFDDDYFDESMLETDRIESPCKRKCSKNSFDQIIIILSVYFLRMRYDDLSTRLR